MAVLMRDLYRDTRRQFKMKLIAGRAGLNRVVNWIYLAEDIENRDFIEGNELIISTAFSLSFDQNWLKPFVQAMIEQNTSGLILNVGKYVEESDITPDIIELCELHKYPLLTIPWEIHLSHLTHEYWNRLVADRQSISDLGAAVRSCLRDGSAQPQSVSVFAQHYWHHTDTYCIAAVTFSCAPTDAARCRDRIIQQSTLCPSIRKSSFVSLESDGLIVLAWHNVSEASIYDHLSELLDSCQSFSDISDIRIGVSSMRKGYDQLPILYRQALAALGAARHGALPVCNFGDLGCYQILFEVSDRRLLKEYYKKYLSVLEEYDRQHESNYLETLECYLKCDRHLAKVAEMMICHRNTVNYRVNKIRDILGLDFNDAEVKFQLTLAINIKNFLELYPEPE